MDYHASNWDAQVEFLRREKIPSFSVEVDVRAFGSESLKDLCANPDWHATKDRSLDTDLGVKLVVRPIGYDRVRERSSQIFGELWRYCEGHEAGPSYGNTVNISKADWGISDLQLGKILVFLNCGTNRRLVDTVAQRWHRYYAQYSQEKIADEPCLQSEKYEYLRVDEDRLEFRIFCSFAQANLLIKNLQFVGAVVEFTRRGSIQELSTSNFLDWLGNQPDEPYRELKDFLNGFETFCYPPKTKTKTTKTKKQQKLKQKKLKQQKLKQKKYEY
jgi:hypothetical protein